ncbi:MAG: NADP-dependent oxidoreductase [Bacteroidota bacterium]|nr:NADP-dependent oxidoreductase [Bacteroidota bacterium]
MKAVIINKYGEPDVLRVSEVDYPDLKENGVIIKVMASSVNPIDCKIRKGNQIRKSGVEFPLILGYDVAGEIVEIGSQVKKFKTGDWVYCRLDSDFGGAYAQFAQAREEAVAFKPDNISFYEAACIPLAGLTALQALRDYAKLQEGESILINGASGGVGGFALQLAKQRGAIVTAVCSSKHSTMIEELNPNKFIDYSQTDFTKLKEKYDVIVDVNGNKNFANCSSLLKKDGRYITTQTSTGGLIYKIILKLALGKSSKEIKMQPSADDLDILTKMVKENKIAVFVDTVFPLDELRHAHYYLENNHPKGKIAIDIGQ